MVKQYEDILNVAFDAMKKAYAPYSNYHVGACVKTKDGKLIPGVNIENASYGSNKLCRKKCSICSLLIGLS